MEVRQTTSERKRAFSRRAALRACVALLAGFALSHGTSLATSDLPSTPSSFSSSASVELTWHEKAWLAKHHNIRVGAETNYAPYEFKDADGKFTGIIADYLEIIKHRVDAQFQVSQLRDFATVEEKLRKRELDVILAIAPSTVANPRPNPYSLGNASCTETFSRTRFPAIASGVMFRVRNRPVSRIRRNWRSIRRAKNIIRT